MTKRTTDGQERKALQRADGKADLSHENIERLAESLPEPLQSKITDVAGDARALAFLVLDLSKRALVLEQAVDACLDTDDLGNGGDLLNAVAAATGLRVAFDVLSGLAEVLSAEHDLAGDDVVARMREYARQHYAEIGLPVIMNLDDDRDIDAALADVTAGLHARFGA